MRRVVKEIVAVLIIVAMLAGFATPTWLALPADRSSVSAEGVVVSLSAGAPESKYYPRRAYEVIMLRLADGRPARLKRALACKPRLAPGDRVRLAGLRNHAGGTEWSVAGETCLL